MTTAARARLSLLLAAALFSTGGAAIKSSAFTGVEVAGLRSAIAAATLVVCVPRARAWPAPRAWLVGLAYAATLILFVLANKLTSAASTIFLQSTAPLYILLLGPWLLRERITRRDLVFLAALAIGLVLLLQDERATTETATDPGLGNALALGSGVAWALTVVGLRWLSSASPGATGEGSSHGLGAVVAGNALAALACAPFALPLRSTDGLDWAVVGYLGVFQIALAYVLVTFALRVVPAFEAALWLLVEPILSPLWAWIVHGERPGPWTLAGGVVLAIATLWNSRRPTAPA